VGTVFARIVGSLQVEAPIMATRDIIARNSRAAEFHVRYLRDHTIPQAIRKVLPKDE